MCLLTLIHAQEKLELNTDNQTQRGDMKLQMIYWPQKPFIFLDSEASLGGIIPVIFVTGGITCTNSLKTDILQPTVNLKNRELHDTTMMNYTHMKYGEGLLKNITTPNAVIWGPHNVHPAKISPFYVRERKLGVYPIMTSSKLAVVHPRSSIALHNKILRGVGKCDKIIYISMLFALLFGCVVWIYERSINPGFKVRTGVGTSLYWSFVTMTTVGYGDVTPVTLVGRVLAVVWMFVGLMIASVMTATLTDTVIGIRGLEIENQDIAVLKDSHEECIIYKDYNARPKLYKSYEEVIEAVRKKEVYAAVLPVEITAWMQEDIRNPLKENPLSIVYTIPGKVKFNMFISKKPFDGSDALFRCIFSTYKEAIVHDTLDYFDRNIYIETIYYDDFTLSILNDPVYIAVFAISILIIATAICLTLLEWSGKISNQNQNKEKEKNEKIDSLIIELRNLLGDYQRAKTERGMNDRPTIKIQPPE